MVEYLAHLLLRIDKPVAADGQSRLDTRYLQRLIYQRLRSLKAGGHPEHLAVGRIVSAIDVVVGAGRGRHHVHHLHRRARTSSAAARHDQVGLMVAEHLRGSDGSVHLSYPTLLEHNVGPAFKDLRQLLILLVHRNDDSYLFHVFQYTFCLDKGMPSDGNPFSSCKVSANRRQYKKNLILFYC